MFLIYYFNYYNFLNFSFISINKNVLIVLINDNPDSTFVAFPQL